jgi:dipeptidyl aminopeptidase/acylaminoacyl peptidase
LRISPLVLFLTLPSLFAQTPNPPTIDQSLEMIAVSSPRISPDGSRVLYTQTRTDWEANAFETDLYLASAGSDPNPRRLTAPVKSATKATWSPDGKWIAFLSNRAGQLPKSPADKSQIYLIRPDGGEALQLTNFESGVASFIWAPNSKSIAFSADDPETKTQKDRKETFGDYHVIHADYTMRHLWLIDLPADPAITHPSPVRLTEGSFSVGEFSFSPDSTRIAFSAQRDPDLISDFSQDLYTVAIAGHTVKKIVDTPGPDGSPIWSPDGSHIAFITADASKNFFFSNNRLASVSAEGGKPEILDPAFDEDADLIAWASAGIYFSAQQKTASQLFLLDPATKTARPVSPSGQMFAQASISPDFTHLAFRGASSGETPEIFTTNLDSFHPDRITRAGEQLAAYPHSTREVIQWKSGDGTVIEGVLQKPADFDPSRKYPLLVVIHGGPTGVDTPFPAPDRYYPTERFLARGALVLHPNYRGSAGYGEKFRSLNVRNLGIGDYADVISGVDYLISSGMVDKNKVGSMGWSEGGYISAFITAFSDRFQAVSVGAGISDWSTYYYNTDITPFTRQYLGANPSDDPEIYRKTSPITYIAKGRTPTLIQQGSEDKRVPVADSFELRQALEDHNVPVKMVLYDGFGHPINKPRQQRAVMEENELWFNHYIWGDPLPASLTPRKSDAVNSTK